MGAHVTLSPFALGFGKNNNLFAAMANPRGAKLRTQQQAVEPALQIEPLSDEEASADTHAQQNIQASVLPSRTSHLGLYFGLIFVGLVCTGSLIGHGVELVSGTAHSGAEASASATPFIQHKTTTLSLPQNTSLLLDLAPNTAKIADTSSSFYVSMAKLMAGAGLSLQTSAMPQVFATPAGNLALATLTLSPSDKSQAQSCLGFASLDGVLHGALCRQNADGQIIPAANPALRGASVVMVSGLELANTSALSTLAQNLSCLLQTAKNLKQVQSDAETKATLRNINRLDLSPEVLTTLKALPDLDTGGNWPAMPCYS